MRPYVRPPATSESPGPPLIEGTAPFNGDPVTHPTRGDGFYAWSDWEDQTGAYVPPLERREDNGQWIAVVTTEFGGFRCPITELRRRR